MKIKIAGRSAVLILCVVCFGCNRNPTQLPGRYQIWSGTCDYSQGNDNFNTSGIEHIIIKVDTVTGQTWKYNDTFMMGTNSIIINQGWEEIKSYSTNSIH